MAVPTQEKCEICGHELVVWMYYAADGDLLFRGGSEIIYGDSDPVKRAALLCTFCDRTDRFPRRQ